MRSNDAIPFSPHATASPSTMQERGRSLASASTISGKRSVRSLPGRLYSLTRVPSLRAITRKPSCLISCSHSSPDGGCEAELGRHGAMKPAGRARGCESMSEGELEDRAESGQRQPHLPALSLHLSIPSINSLHQVRNTGSAGDTYWVKRPE